MSRYQQRQAVPWDEDLRLLGTAWNDKFVDRLVLGLEAGQLTVWYDGNQGLEVLGVHEVTWLDYLGIEEQLVQVSALETGSSV